MEHNIPHAVFKFLGDTPKPLPDSEIYLPPPNQKALVTQDQAFIFPTERLARRYAEAIMGQYTDGGSIWGIVATPGRQTSMPTHPASCRLCGCTGAIGCPNHCHWVEEDLCSECRKPDPLEMWTVYDKPADAPTQFIARKFIGLIPTGEVVITETLTKLRAQKPRHLSTITRSEGDDPVIVETWL